MSKEIAPERGTPNPYGSKAADGFAATAQAPRNDIVNVPMAKQRDIQTVTTEIRTLTKQGQRLILEYAIEIGRRLCEAKSMLPHGEWGNWLREEVEFSQSTANNFMRMFEEYGADQISIFGAEAKSQTIGNLPYTKALKLLALPAEEREEFVQTKDVAQMSSRELERAIRERDAARKQAQDAEGKIESLQRDLSASNEIADSLRTELSRAKEDVKAADDEAVKNERELKLKLKLEEAEDALAEAKEEIEAAHKQIGELRENTEIPQEKLDKLAKDAEDAAKKRFEEQKKKLIEAAKESEQKAKDAEARIEELRRKLSTASKETAQFELMFRKVQEDFAELLKMVYAIEDGNAELGMKLRKAVAAVAEDVLKKVGRKT